MQVSSPGSAGNAALIQQMRQQMFSRADKDRDGSVSLAEFQALGKPAASAATAAMDAAFKTLDSDGDGKLNAAEMAKARPHLLHGGSRPALGAEGMSALLGAQEVGQAAAGGGIEGVMARMLQAYGGKAAA
ncbi:EF-hand domain-containing protein [Belnapia sp. T18]|uniref:EF-hand domain-containing protein n=1 Tax=Belnapia arida TaxID=2804533 RepID=A0ABS1U224_9PROT|nr:EF-hand domain-containing protein [Belnapia arida]MBL6078748.1 EF-hand domain-containing protein [Belnapia arida]